MKWKEIDDKERSAVFEAESENGDWYEIIPNSQYIDQEPDGYLLSNGKGYLNRQGEICCGFGLYCAVGIPQDGKFKEVEEAKMVAENCHSKETSDEL